MAGRDGVAAVIRVVLVDDQPLIRAGLRMLCDAEADLLLTDIRMPGGTSGFALAAAAVAARPGLKVLYMSGYYSDADEASGL